LGMNVLSDPAACIVVGHRGAAAHFPENTAASFDHAVCLGVDAIEFDLRVSRDGVVVVIHDPTVDRTTNGTGAVADLTVAELKKLDAGSKFTRDGGRTFPWRGRGLQILTFDELLDRYPSIPLLIELKLAASSEPARQAIESHSARDRVLLDSMELDALAPFRRAPFLTGACFDDVLGLLPRALVGGSTTSLPYSALCIPPWYKGLPIPVRRLAKLVRRRGVPTHVWTVNDPAIARSLWAAGVNGIITDDPETMLSVRRALLSEGQNGRLDEPRSVL
jgi:glycerophosphoryl diester phosphodiesterase